MNRRARVHAAHLLTAVLCLSCASPNAPDVPGGRVVLRLQPNAPGSQWGNALVASAPSGPIDSVAVRVFRGGGAIVLETVAGEQVTGSEPIELTIPCIAETGKRVSVELFVTGIMSHHGSDTDVDVATDQSTSINIDAYSFTVDSLSVTPAVVPAGSSFSLAWDAATAAAWYQVQASGTPDFAVIEWEQTVVDTVMNAQLPVGAHYIRVSPRTQFASGTPAGPEFGYTVGGAGTVDVTGFNPGAQIPDETFTIFGENLDYPGTQAWIGSVPLPIEASSWGALQVRLPRVATTNNVTVVSGAGWLGFDTSDIPFVAQRVAYVTDGDKMTLEYIETLMRHTDDFGYSGVVRIEAEELDWRDMDVFDTIVIADNMATNAGNWGGKPARAAAIIFSRANVLAIGKGGAIFLQIATSAADVPHDPRTDSDGTYYCDDASASIFTTPHSVTVPDIKVCSDPAATLALQIDSSPAPAGVNLYATTDCARLIVCTGPNDRWVMADFRLLNPSSTPVVYFYWGYTDDPKLLSLDGSNCLGNVMNMLQLDRP